MHTTVDERFTTFGLQDHEFHQSSLNLLNNRPEGAKTLFLSPIASWVSLGFQLSYLRRPSWRNTTPFRLSTCCGFYGSSLETGNMKWRDSSGRTSDSVAESVMCPPRRKTTKNDQSARITILFVSSLVLGIRLPLTEVKIPKIGKRGLQKQEAPISRHPKKGRSESKSSMAIQATAGKMGFCGSEHPFLGWWQMGASFFS